MCCIRTQCPSVKYKLRVVQRRSVALAHIHGDEQELNPQERSKDNVRNNTAAFTDILTCGRCVVMWMVVGNKNPPSAGLTLLGWFFGDASLHVHLGRRWGENPGPFFGPSQAGVVRHGGHRVGNRRVLVLNYENNEDYHAIPIGSTSSKSPFVVVSTKWSD